MRPWIGIQEHEVKHLRLEEFSEAEALELHSLYGRVAQIDITWPSPRTDWQWQITAGSNIGSLPLSSGGGVRIEPKVPLTNLFHMLAVAYRTRVRFLDGSAQVDSVDGLFDLLVHHLLSLVMARVRRGLARDYVPMSDRLPYLRGRPNIHRQMQAQDLSLLECDFEEHTADVHDNQVLVWTLRTLLRTASLRSDTRAAIRRGLYAMGSTIQALPIRASQAVRPAYDRLTKDYEAMHLICRFLLDHVGPTHRAGAREIAPFLIPMPRLYELFVSQDLEGRLPDDLRMEKHARLHLDEDQQLHFDIDMVIRERATGQARLVLDAKYKASDTPAASDVSQAVAYAVAAGCRRAALIYPVRGQYPLANVGDVDVHRLAMDLDGDLEASGATLAETVIRLVGAQDARPHARQRTPAATGNPAT